MYFKENLRLLRKKNSISQNEIANALGYKSFTTVQKWEDGTSMPSMGRLQKLAGILGVALDDLINKNLSIINYVPIPVVGTIRTGPAIFAQQNISEYEYVNIEEAKDGEYFYLDVVGDSMKDIRILEGDRVYIKKQSTLENGEVGVVLIEDEATLKRVFYDKDKLVLKSENEAYEPMVFTRKDIDEKNIKVLGKLIHNKIKY